MGTTLGLKRHSPQDPADDDEGFPLYKNLQPIQVDTVPAGTATSAEVRDYLTVVLITKHHLSDDHTRRLVSRWTVGRGYELRSYTAQMYLDIFGRDVGWVLYRDIQLEIYRTRQKTYWETRGIYITPPTSFTFASAAIILATRRISGAVSGLAIVFGMFGGVVCIISLFQLAVHIVDGGRPEKQVEAELQRCSMRSNVNDFEVEHTRQSNTPTF